MKLVTYQTSHSAAQLGALRGETLINLSAAHAAAGGHSPFPTTMLSLLEAGASGMALAREAISASTCRAWATRYGLSFPELMDPMFITQPFVPNTAFPGNIIVDRCGRIRWREYGSENGLTSMRTAIDEVLADPRYPACPTE